MRIPHFFALGICIASVIHAASIPDINTVARAADHPRPYSDFLSPDNVLEKRKGGGGKGGGGSGGSSSGGKSSSSGSKSGNSGGASSSSSNKGGQTKAGSGVRPMYGGGAFYGGGASVPVAAGARSAKGLLAGALILPAAVLLIMPGLWLYSVYPYHFTHPAQFVNSTLQNATNSNGVNQTLPVLCLCQQFSVCGCDDTDNSTYYTELVGDGNYQKLNKSLVTVSDVNGTRTLVINGTLPNGTTASGGTDSAASRPALQLSGYWAMGAIVLYTVAFL